MKSLRAGTHSFVVFPVRFEYNIDTIYHTENLANKGGFENADERPAETAELEIHGN